MSTTAAPETSTAADVRAWATAKGLQVGSRGRFSAAIIDAYNKTANGKRAPYVAGAKAVAQ